jgi:hypothetical protein
MKRSVLSVLSVLLAGCQTPYLDPNYSAALQAHQERERLWAQVAMERARAERERYIAIQLIGERGDSMAKQTALMALAFVNGAGTTSSVEVNRYAPLPVIPETQEDKALKWAAIFAGPVMSVAQGYFGYRLGVTQSNNAAAASIASYDSMSRVGIAGFDSISTVAQSGFRTNAEIAGFGINLGRDTLTSFARPNVIVTNGVLGSGSYVGDNSGAFSGNSGRIGSPDCPNSAGNGGLGGNELLPGSGGTATINCPSGRP